MSIKDFTGHKIENLTVIALYDRTKGGSYRWLCRCVCGNDHLMRGEHLNSGTVISCGCHKRALVIARNTTHGKSRTPTYSSWAAMVRRCTDCTNPSFVDYGARGILVCEKWRNSFEAFYADLGERPSGCSLGRIDNNQSYEPGNCRWETTKEQARNKRNTRWFTLHGITKSLAEWAEEAGITGSIVWKRLKRGWSVEKALTTGYFSNKK